MIQDISANQLWKKAFSSGKTSLAFVPWLEREKAKAYFCLNGSTTVPLNRPLNDSIQRTVNELRITGGLKTEAGKEYYLGIKKSAWVGSGIALVVVIGGIIIYKKMKK